MTGETDIPQWQVRQDLSYIMTVEIRITTMTGEADVPHWQAFPWHQSSFTPIRIWTSHTSVKQQGGGFLFHSTSLPQMWRLIKSSTFSRLLKLCMNPATLKNITSPLPPPHINKKEQKIPITMCPPNYPHFPRTSPRGQPNSPNRVMVDSCLPFVLVPMQ